MTAPSSAERMPIVSSRPRMWVLPRPNIWKTRRPIATMPKLYIRPENSADTGPDVAVCTSASQPWNGTSPAFVAKPATSRPSAIRSGQGVMELGVVERAGGGIEQPGADEYGEAGQRGQGQDLEGGLQGDRAFQ